MNQSKHDNLSIACLRLGAFLCFAGWTWVHYYWEGPYGVLLWHDSTFKLATRFGVVERAQTSHLPDPVDPRKIGQGIGVYFTNLNWGNIDFAILKDRKFKTGPAGRVPKQGPRPDHIRNPDYDPASVDVAGAILLGQRQLDFLNAWAQDWRDAKMKVALSQTIFCGGAHVQSPIYISAGGSPWKLERTENRGAPNTRGILLTASTAW